MSILNTGFKPLWVVGDAGAIQTFPHLGGIEALTIFADNDGNGVGEAAATACGERLAAEGMEVRSLTPPDVGADWNDQIGRAA